MWLAYAFLSAAMLGCYDVFKKHALRGNSVLPVLFLNTLFCSLIFLLPLLHLKQALRAHRTRKFQGKKLLFQI